MGQLENMSVFVRIVEAGGIGKAADQLGMAKIGDFLHDMVLAGHGIVMLPTFIVWQSLTTGELLPVLDQYPPQKLSAWAVYPQTRYLSQRVRQFIDFLMERFGAHPYWDDF